MSIKLQQQKIKLMCSLKLELWWLLSPCHKLTLHELMSFEYSLTTTEHDLRTVPLLLLVQTRSAHHARHGLSTHARCGCHIDVINYATKIKTKMKEKFRTVTKSNLMNLHLIQEYQNSSKSIISNCSASTEKLTVRVSILKSNCKYVPADRVVRTQTNCEGNKMFYLLER